MAGLGVGVVILSCLIGFLFSDGVRQCSGEKAVVSFIKTQVKRTFAITIIISI